MIFSSKYRVIRILKNNYNWLRLIIKKDKTKIFCVGRNKTGTTSLKVAMENLGYVVGNQRSGELLFDNWKKGNYSPIINFCHTAQFFQDIPFSFPGTYKILDKAYPKSKFILTIRDSPEQWFESLTRFHSKLWGKNGRIPTKEDLKNASYISKGRQWSIHKALYNAIEEEPYNKKILIEHYTNHNQEIIEYFTNRPQDLLILNVSEKGAYKKLTRFLGVQDNGDEFPWENKT